MSFEFIWEHVNQNTIVNKPPGQISSYTEQLVRHQRLVIQVADMIETGSYRPVTLYVYDGLDVEYGDDVADYMMRLYVTRHASTFGDKVELKPIVLVVKYFVIKLGPAVERLACIQPNAIVASNSVEGASLIMPSPAAKLEALEAWCRVKLRAVLRLSRRELRQPWFDFGTDVLSCIETFDQNEVLQFLMKRDARFDHFTSERLCLSNLIRFDDDELEKYPVLHAIATDPNMRAKDVETFRAAAGLAFLSRNVSLRLPMWR